MRCAHSDAYALLFAVCGSFYALAICYWRTVVVMYGGSSGGDGVWWWWGMVVVHGVGCVGGDGV